MALVWERRNGVDPLDVNGRADRYVKLYRVGRVVSV